MAQTPDAKHLLELLQRAAEELKSAQHDGAAAQAEARQLEEKLKAAEAALAQVRSERERWPTPALERSPASTLVPGPAKRPRAGAHSALVTTLVSADSSLDDDDRTSVAGMDTTTIGLDEPTLLAARLASLQRELREVELDRKQLTERVKVCQSQHGELEHELGNARAQLILEQARGADVLTRLQAWEQRSAELEQALSTEQCVKGQEHGQLEQLVGQLSQVETELTTERARTQALNEQLESLVRGSSDEQQRLFDATSRIAQLEVDLAGLRHRRDELNLELGKVENDRNQARARVVELEQTVRELAQREHHKRNELDQLLAQERDKHQSTGSKLVEARGRQRELEEQLGVATGLSAELRAGYERQVIEHDRALLTAQHAHEASTHSLQQHLGELSAQLEHATTEWRHVERHYETLHREMLTLLDQRDEARRQLEASKGHASLP
jgi:chromosome segregation ATPase